jgi:catechol 2,3-dioxygenase-like lactoylglutathione lyase family enzyme
MFKYSHSGICVADLDRSVRFYCDGLGFRLADRHDIGPGYGPSLEVEGGVDLVCQFLRRDDGLTVELLAFGSPNATGSPSSRRNQLGLTHLSFWVDDLTAAAAHLVACGGALVEGTSMDEGVPLVFIADPDGTRVELMQRPPRPPR